MPKQTKAPPLTLVELWGRADIPERDRNRIEELAVRLIQIQDETRTLETERGYTRGGERVPGIADELEGLYVKYSLTGLQFEDYSVTATHGSMPRIDRDLLLARGVLADDINAATVTSHWTGVTVRRKGDREGPGGDPRR